MSFSPHHDDLRLMNPLQPAEFGREMLNPRRRAPERDKFHAQIVREMHVHARHDEFAVSMLDLDHRVREVGLVVVVDEREAGGDVRGVGRDRRGGQLLAKQLPDGLAPRGELPLGAERVEAFEQIGFEGHREPYDFGHVVAPLGNGVTIRNQ